MDVYPQYKDSGVPWLGAVPEHWDAIKTKHLFRERVQKGYPNEPLLAATQTKGVVPKSMYENRTVEAQKDLHLLKLVEPGDFVISLRSFQGGIEYAYYRGIISPAYTVMVPNKRILPAYYRHLAKSKKYISLLQTCVTGIREGQNINYEILRKTPIPVPTQDEQQQISRYLDWQTSKINKFIKAKKKLIALLKEQKQNVINEAVTKGINPDVKMKDSGVEWLGAIPAYWEVRKLKFLSTKFGSGVTPKGGAAVYQETGITFLRSQNVHFDGLRLNEVAFISNEIHQQMKSSHVKPNDVLLNITGASIGRTCYIPENFAQANVNQHVCIIRPRIDVIKPEYLSFYLATPIIQRRIIEEQNESSREGLTLSSIKGFYVVLPSADEQYQIIKHIEKETAIIDKTIARTEREIELIQEYRTRLVSDVVTGKVDVRSVEIPDFEPVEADLEDQIDEEAEDELITEGNEE